MPGNIVESGGQALTIGTITDGEFLKRVGTTVGSAAAGGGAADYPLKLKPALVRWVMPGWYNSTFTTIAITADRIYYIPIFVQETTTYIRIAIYVDTGVAGTAELRIYNWTSGLPSSLLLAAGTVDTGSSGHKEIIISQQLTRGYYFLAIRTTAAPTLIRFDGTRTVAPPTGSLGSGIGSTDKVILVVDAVFADPAPAPTAATEAIYAFVYLREN